MPPTKACDHIQDLVVVFETSDRERFEVAADLLAQAGIPFTVSGQLVTPVKSPKSLPYLHTSWHSMAITTLIRPPLAWESHWVQVKVLHEQEAAAREILRHVS